MTIHGERFKSVRGSSFFIFLMLDLLLDSVFFVGVYRLPPNTLIARKIKETTGSSDREQINSCQLCTVANSVVSMINGFGAACGFSGFMSCLSFSERFMTFTFI
jgi:hypothetical protein